MKADATRSIAIYLVLFVASLSPLTASAERLAPADFDGDGLSDFVLISASKNVLSWSAVTGSGASQQALGDFGRLGFHVTLGDWLGTGLPQPATVTTLGSKIIWRVLSSGVSIQREFGTTGDTVVAGADFSGDGAVDATIVSKGSNGLNWRVHAGLFTDSNLPTTDFTFGRVKDNYFFANPDATNDRVASITNKGQGAFLLRYFNPKTLRGTRLLVDQDLPSAQLKKSPLPLRDATGKDMLLFYSRRGSATTFSLFKSKKKTLEVFRLKATGEVLVGNYTTDAGDEVAVQTESGFLVYNPLTKVKSLISAPAGIAVDEVNINTLGEPEDNTPAPPPPPPSDQPPLAGLFGVCEKYSAIANGEMLIKSEISQHIPGQDPRATGYTLVCARLCPKNLSRSDFFFADGSYAGSVARYGTFHGNGKPRLYGAVGEAPQHFASDIAAKASTIGNGKLYMQISSARSGAGTDCKEFNPTGRNGGLY
jgi:hypothetical protein